MLSVVNVVTRCFGGFLAQSLSPNERFGALNKMSSPGGSWWMWGLALAAGGLLLLSTIGLLYYRVERKKREWQGFDRLAGQAGLGDKEKDLLKLLCKLARLKKPESVFTMEPAFEYAVGALQQTRRFLSRPRAEQQELLRLCGLIREKLGFLQTQDTAVESEGVSRKITPGAKLSIVHRGRASGFDAVVDSASPSDLLVSPTTPVECKPGESWLVRYSREGKVWEFDATVSDNSEGKVRLSHMERARYINRRRFRRVPTDRPAMATVYPFAVAGQVTPPQFAPCRMTEIAGCGLRLRGPLSVRTGARVLALIQVEPEKTLQGFGRIRRVVTKEGDDEAEFAIELVGLSESEVDALVRYTNIAERRESADRSEQPKTRTPAGAPA
jgi:hypothetical protein